MISNFGDLLDTVWKKNKWVIVFFINGIVFVSGQLIVNYFIDTRNSLETLQAVSHKNEEKISYLKEITEKLQIESRIQDDTIDRVEIKLAEIEQNIEYKNMKQ